MTYEMLTGEPPHIGNTSQAIIARVLTDKPRSVRSSRVAVPEHVEAAVERALEKLPADRFSHGERICRGAAGARRRYWSASTGPRQLRRRRSAPVFAKGSAIQ